MCLKLTAFATWKLTEDDNFVGPGSFCFSFEEAFIFVTPEIV